MAAEGRGHRGTAALLRLVEHAPASGGLALWMPHRDLPEPPLADLASRLRGLPAEAPLITDGRALLYHPVFERLSLARQTGHVAHAMLHVALRHAQRFGALQQALGDADLELFNTCADAIVNSALGHLDWLELAADAVTLESLLWRTQGQRPTAEAALLAWDVESLYRFVDDRRPLRAGRQGVGREDGPRAASVRALGAATPPDLQPAPDPQAPPEAEADSAREWSERLLRAHADDGGFSVLRALPGDLPQTRTPWELLLRTRLARALAPRRALSWSRPSRAYIANQGRAGPGRRWPWEPGHSASTLVPRLVLVVDISGSVDEGLLARFAGEVEAIARRQQAGLTLVLGDDAVRHVVTQAPGRVSLRGLQCDGGGGTDFTPLLEEADRHHPDITVVLTDLDGPARFRPRWPVLWAVPPAHAAAQAPFGRKIVLR